MTRCRDLDRGADSSQLKMQECELAICGSECPWLSNTHGVAVVISRKSTTDTFLLLNMERGDHTHSYYDRGLMAHSKIDMISIIGRYCM